jgi:predicted nucleotidyltransferase
VSVTVLVGSVGGLGLERVHRGPKARIRVMEVIPTDAGPEETHTRGEYPAKIYRFGRTGGGYVDRYVEARVEDFVVI